MLFIRSHKKTTMHSILGLSIWIIFLLSPVIATTDRREELLRNYSRFVLPPERPVSVTINLALYELIDLDVAGESVHCLFWQRNTWNDKRLAWTLDTADPESSSLVRFAYKDVWMPDVIPYNDIGVYDSWKYQDLIFLSGDPNGTITWAHPAPMQFTCTMDVIDFPFDSHDCDVILASWQYKSSEIDFKCEQDHVDIDTFSGSMQWQVTGTSCREVEKLMDLGTYNGLVYTITFKRLDLFYTRIIFWPNIALLTFSSLMFFLPVEHSDRASFGMTVLLALSVNMMVITNYIPETSRNFPRACNFFLASMVFCGCGVILVCVIDRNSLYGNDASRREEVDSDSDEYSMQDLQNGQIAENGTVVPRIKKNTKSRFRKFVKWCYVLQRTLKDYEHIVGVVYFVGTLVAHFWSFLGSYIHEHSGK